PDFEDTLRLPCLATRAPAAAATKLDAVEMLKVWAPSPPVPTMSTRWVRSATATGRANSRSTSAAAAISPTVSFLTRSPVRIAAVIAGGTSPRITMRIRSTISSWKISRCPIVRCRASCGVIVISGCPCVGAAKAATASPLQEILQQGVPVFGQDRLRMELHALHRMLAMAQPHHLLDAAVLVLGPGRHFQALGQRVLVDHQRV